MQTVLHNIKHTIKRQNPNSFIITVFDYPEQDLAKLHKALTTKMPTKHIALFLSKEFKPNKLSLQEVGL